MPRPISKGLDHFLYVCVFLLASILYIHICLYRSRLCHAFFPPWACSCRSFGLLACVVAFVPLVACLDVTTYEMHLCDVGVLDTHLSPLCVMMLCLPCQLCAIHLAFFFSLHFYTLAYMFMHESVCHPHSNLTELWTSNPNLHFVLLGYPLLFDNMFVCPRLALFDSLSFSMLSF